MKMRCISDVSRAENIIVRGIYAKHISYLHTLDGLLSVTKVEAIRVGVTVPAVRKSDNNHSVEEKRWLSRANLSAQHFGNAWLKFDPPLRCLCLLVRHVCGVHVVVCVC